MWKLINQIKLSFDSIYEFNISIIFTNYMNFWNLVPVHLVTIDES